MAVTHTWEIVKLSQVNNGTGTISDVSFKVTSVDGDFSAVNESDVQLSTENIEDFISYEDLDEQTVISWVKDKLSQESRDPEARNVLVININKNPPAPKVIEAPLPW